MTARKAKTAAEPTEPSPQCERCKLAEMKLTFAATLQRAARAQGRVDAYRSVLERIYKRIGDLGERENENSTTEEMRMHCYSGALELETLMGEIEQMVGER